MAEAKHPEVAPAQPVANPGDKSFWIPSAFGMTLAIVVMSTTFMIHIKADDIWWHLRTGEFILTTWNLPDLNIFSFSAPGHQWLPHEWLSEVVFYLIYSSLGFKGLIALGIILNAIACGLVYRLTERYSRSPYLSMVITMLAGLMMLGNYSLRPYLFGNLFFIATLHAMEEPAAGGKLRPALIFLLFSGWANFHGSFLIGLALIMLYLAASMANHFKGPKRSWAPSKALLLDLGVAIVACMFTPHHVYGLIFPLTYLQKAFSGEMTYLTNISEWQAAGFSTPLGRMITFYVMFCMFAVVGSGMAPSPIHLGLLVAFSFFAFTTIRNIPLLGIAATPVLARHLPRALGRTTQIFRASRPPGGALEKFHTKSVDMDRRSRKLLLPAVLAVGMTVVFCTPPHFPMSYEAQTGIHSLEELSPDFYPRGLMDQVSQLDSNKRVFNYFNWGGAFIWALYPKQRVFIDQRNDCYPIEVFLDYFAVHELKRDWQFVLDRWEIDAVAYPKNSELANRLAQDIDWMVAYEDSQTILFVREAPAPWFPEPDDAAAPTDDQDTPTRPRSAE